MFYDIDMLFINIYLMCIHTFFNLAKEKTNSLVASTIVYALAS